MQLRYSDRYMKKQIGIAIIIGFMFTATGLKAQSERTIVDEVAGIVGGEMVLLSDIETAYLQYKPSMPTITKCEVFDELLFQKLLITQAELDSITVSDAQVDMELDNRIRYFTNQFGSKQKLEEFYGKTLDQIRSEFREAIHDQILVETVKAQITANVKATPTEVKQYFESLRWDQVPEIPTTYEVCQIVKEPKVGTKELEEAYNKIVDIKKRVDAGEDFATLAILYSEDKGSASNGGSIGTVGRGETFTEFEAAAFALKDGEVSDIVKTQAGYHIIKMISRKGDYIDVLHILIRPKVSPYELQKAKSYLDSVYQVIKTDTMSFEMAAKKFSDDDGKINGGIITNPYTGSSLFDAQQLGAYDPTLFFSVEKLNVGDISYPIQFQTAESNDAFRIVYLKSRTSPHKANLKDDYNTIKNMAEQDKANKAIAKWVQEKAAKTYVQIKERYADCEILDKWTTNNN